MNGYQRNILLWASVFIFSRYVYEVGASVKVSYLRSPAIKIAPGIASNKYYQVEFPQGHVAVKNVYAEVVNDGGQSVSLTQVYLHHWTLQRYYKRRGSYVSMANISALIKGLQNGDLRSSSKNGTCHGDDVAFGSGSETRRTDYSLPDPYAVEVGNPNKVPYGYEEKWVLNVHVIDTIGVIDPIGCLECRCDLFNATTNFAGKALPLGYKGGLSCCTDQRQCKLKQGFKDATRTLYLKYVVHWIEWTTAVLPVKLFGFDITVPKTSSMDPHLSCQGKVEYQVDPCSDKTKNRIKCVDDNTTRAVMPDGGHAILIYGHQHVGGLGAAIYDKDGKLLCLSKPIYGDGNEIGNEKGYVVGMTTCRPKPGALKLSKNETIVLQSVYSSSQLHTGVMGLFGLVVADHLPTEQQK